ncbi:hypothetical protein CCACVL1_25220 [Corchorus capsularis]|uniref:Uncharacterized protein n=1 Tax=Corchorus capsularis TaxID=210143 RepID=A0A1R3GLM9_COCAP|nr:hypothetical protein CCACVL1_25220 [Corchorus capsularis]
MFEAVIDARVRELGRAVGIMSSLGNRAIVKITDAGLTIKVRDNEVGLPAAELRLNRNACRSYGFQPTNPLADNDHFFINNLTPLGQFLEQATDQDILLLLHNPLPNDQRNRLVAILLNPAARQGRSLIKEDDPLENAPTNIVDEAPYMVTATIESRLFRDTVEGLRYTIIDENGQRTDGLDEVTLQELAGDVSIQSAAALDDIFSSDFELAELRAFINAAQRSGTVSVHVDHADQGRTPLLHCPFGHGLGKIFFYGHNIVPN